MMRQAQIAQGKISKLRHTLMTLKDGEQQGSLGVGDGMTPALTEVLLMDVADIALELHRYLVMVEQKCEQAEIQANRRRFY